jgi:hypothetical protein
MDFHEILHCAFYERLSGNFFPRLYCLQKVMLKLRRKNACFNEAGGYASDSVAMVGLPKPCMYLSRGARQECPTIMG